ncbi:glutathione S-transferase family protein [Paraburkholderia phosphatilytica]|uniref:glutathione S-transferase family protein n=1 Tax=Paraburkholderia phosphatilytica TaxID=2282883 RepID=UPI000E504507|nr:glutathione S-transferase [Paraburkholderia phosphatilytica]
MEPVLFYGVPQGCSLGSIVALEWLGLPYRLCRIDRLQPTPEDRNDPGSTLNAHCKTPALLLNGSVLTESFAILSNLAARGVAKRLGFRQGAPEHDRFNEMLAFLHTGFVGAFEPLWTANRLREPDERTRTLLRAQLRTLGRDNVRRHCAWLDGLLAERAWLLDGEERTLVDAYFAGVGRWIEHHMLFEVAREFPHLNRYQYRLREDPAVQFALAIEAGEQVTSANFKGHVTLDELQPKLAA